MKFLVLLSMSFSVAGHSFAAGLHSFSAAGLKHIMPLHKDLALTGKLPLLRDLAKFNKTIADRSLKRLLQTKEIDVLLKELGEKITAAEPVDLIKVDNDLAEDLIVWLELQGDVLYQLNEDITTLSASTTPVGKKLLHGRMQAIDQIERNLATKLFPSSTRFTTLPLIQQELIINEIDMYSSGGLRADEERFYDILANTILNSVTPLFDPAISADYFDHIESIKGKMRHLRYLDGLLGVNLQKALPKTTALPAAEVLASSSIAHPAVKGAAEVVVAGFLYVVQELKQLSSQEIESLLSTVLKEEDNVVEEYNKLFLTYEENLSSTDAVNMSIMHDLAPEGAAVLALLTDNLSLNMNYITEKYLSLLAHEINRMQAAANAPIKNGHPISF